MSFEITVNIPGLKELAEAIGKITANTEEKKQPVVEEKQPVQSYGQQIAPQFPNVNTTVVQPEVLPVQVPPEPVTPAVQTSVPTYTREELSKAAMQLMDKGMQAQLMQLIQSFGVASLVELKRDSMETLQQDFVEWGRRSNGT